MAYIPVFGILSLTFFIIRKIYNASKAGPKEYFIKADLQTGEPLIKKLGLTAGEQLLLVNVENSFEVKVQARGATAMYEDIGTIEDRELYERVLKGTVKGKIFFIYNGVVTVELNY